MWTHTLGAQDVVPAEFADRMPSLLSEASLREIDARREADTLARMAGILDPVVFWCRFCRVTLEPFAHA